ncbi:MAG TPA: nitronate monooxygenase family protein [Xanthobacteraceae bacterium]|nr:nitronate monooxygenase family protein [Xanthobacteraceae bacterium]
MRQMQKLLDLLDIELPIVLAPMAGASTPELVAAVSNAGGLGSYGAAMLSLDQLKSEAARIRTLTNRSYNLGFFCHTTPVVSEAAENNWRAALAPYYDELGVDKNATVTGGRRPFDADYCDAVLAIAPKVISFHFGMPAPELVKRLKDAGHVLIASATTVAEARRLVELGCDAIIAQGFEAGGHRGMFLSMDVATQVGTLALVPQIVDAVDVPVIAAGGIADARGVAAVMALGAAAAQVGTAYMLCPETKVNPAHRAAIKSAADNGTVLTNLFTGRPARGIVNRMIRDFGAINPVAPPFPMAANALTPLRAEAEKRGSGDFTPLWSGQAASLAREMGAGELTKQLAEEARALLRSLAA